MIWYMSVLRRGGAAARMSTPGTKCGLLRRRRALAAQGEGTHSRGVTSVFSGAEMVAEPAGSGCAALIWSLPSYGPARASCMPFTSSAAMCCNTLRFECAACAPLGCVLAAAGVLTSRASSEDLDDLGSKRLQA